MRAALFVLAFLVAPAARADDVEPPPENCPPGSTPRASHAGPTCEPLADCTGDTACAAGERCTEIHQCVARRGCGGRIEDPDCVVLHVMDVCDATTACGGEAECRARRVCMAEPEAAAPTAPSTAPGSPAPASSAPAPSSTCGASPGARAFSGVASLAIALTIAGVLHDRRARRPR